MRDLTRANELIASIASKYPQITPITPEDFELFQSFFTKEPHTYGNSWTYITQGMYGIGHEKLGYKYFDGKNLCAVCAYPKVDNPENQVLFWVRPMGETIVPIIAELSRNIHKNFGSKVYAKKLFKEQNDHLMNLGFRDVSTFPWHSLYPMEDDTFPEQIYDVQKTIQLAENSDKGTKIHRSHRYYKSIKNQPEISSVSAFEHIDDIRTIIDSFFQNDPKVKTVNISNPFDYYGLMNRNPNADMLGKIYYFNGKPISFYSIEVQSDGYASQYATLSLREDSNHIVDYMMFDIFYTLSERHIQYLNLGGSETDTLHEFKQKYHPEKQVTMQWACLVD